MKMLARLDFLYGTEMAKNAANKLKEPEDDYLILGEAELAYTKNDYEYAEQLYILSAERNQLNDKYLAHCFNRLAQISISKFQYIDAYKYIEASRTIYDKNPDTIWLNANILAAEQKYVEALELLNPVVND
jgi:hypothetical protein